MARRDDRSNTTPSSSESANQTDRPASRGSRSRTRTDLGGVNTEPLGAEPAGPLGTEPLGAGPIGSGSMGPGPMGTGALGGEPLGAMSTDETPGAGDFGSERFDRPAGAPDFTPREGARGVKEEVKQEVKGLAQQAKQQTSRVAGQAKSQVNQLVASQKNQMADRLQSVAGALREAGQKLQERESEGYGRYADRAASQVERVSDYLRRQDLNAFVGDLETFARRHPDLFLGGALVAGVLLARFLKASAEPEPWERYPGSAYATPPYEQSGEEYRSYGTGQRYGEATGTYGEPFAPVPDTAGGL